MTEKESIITLDKIPKAKLKTREKSISPVWVIPIIAALMGSWLVFKGAIKENVFVEVTFKSAAGLEAGKTPVKLRNVKVGELTEVKFSEDLSQVIVVMELTGVSRERLTDTTQFWVVKPRVGVEGVSGLDTLLSGAFIEIDPGEGGKPVKKFTGLESPQIYQLGNPGTKYLLNSDSLGSLSRGSPVKYRGINVGSVTRYELVDDHSHVEIEVFIEAPHDKFVTDYSRFWNASGLNIELGAKGFDFNMESIGSLLAGGIAFTNDNAPAESRQAKENNLYTLHNKEGPEIEEILTFGAPMKLYFEEGVSGLSVGAPVEYKGIRLGTVVDVGVEANDDRNNIITFAMVDIEPERLPVKTVDENLSRKERIKNVYQYFEHMVEQGMRAQLKSNILTGQSLIVLDVFTEVDKKRLEYKTGFVVVPTVPETVTGIIKQVNELLSRLKSLPVESIGGNLDEATKNINNLINSLNVEEGGMTGVQANETMNELSKAARSIRVVSEYLERHPEALIKGKTTN
ncbi:MAG: MlaD family protein [Gammaproteobacteria bacterium]|nr:MlaD family protein [Gammaproteobacteria bacterium]